MTAKLDEAKTSLNDLLGLPALIPEDEHDNFKRFHTKLLKELAPETLIDRIEIRNYAIMLFEVARLKALQAGLIESACLMSIQNLLPDQLHHLAVDFYLGDDEDMKAAEEALEKLNIFKVEIDANAFNVQREGASKLEGMIMYRENACRKLAKRFAKLANAKRRADESAQRLVAEAARVKPTGSPPNVK